MKDSIIYVGRKPPIAYAMAIMSSLKDSEDVTLRARGRAISTAVDAAEITKNRFLDDLTFDISIGTEELERDEGGTRNVSTIQIVLRRSPGAVNPGGVSQPRRQDEAA